MTTGRVGGTGFHVVKSPADDWIVSMERQTDFRKQATAAGGALRDDPGCIEAHLFLACHAKEDHDLYSHLAKPVGSGEAL